jgi:hypothetical protein
MKPAEGHGRAELAGLQDRMCDVALIIEDRDVAELVIRLTGVVVKLDALHALDQRKRCLLCRPAGRRMMFRRHQPCTVREVFQDLRLIVPPSDAGAS